MVTATQEKAVQHPQQELMQPELVERVARLLAKDQVGPATVLLMLVQGSLRLKGAKTETQRQA